MQLPCQQLPARDFFLGRTFKSITLSEVEPVPLMDEISDAAEAGPLKCRGNICSSVEKCRLLDTFALPLCLCWRLLLHELAMLTVCRFCE